MNDQKAFTKWMGIPTDHKSQAVADCLKELATTKARLAEAKAKETRKLLRATTMNGTWQGDKE